MKFLIKLLFISILAYVAHVFLPFWSVALAAFFVSMLIKTSGYKSFITGFLGVFLVWSISSYLIDQNTSSILTQRISQLLALNNMAIVLITGFIGGLLGGFGALTGTMLTQLTKK